MTAADRTLPALSLALQVFLIGGWFLPDWAQSLLILAFGKGLVVLGLLLLIRTGLVSFGQGLYYCLGAYAAVSASKILAFPDLMSDALAMPLFGGVVAGVLGLVLGFLLARYRAIFFAMLSLAFSMILYGLLIKMSVLGSSDGFNIDYRTLAGIKLPDGMKLYALYALSTLLVFIATACLHRYLRSHLGRLAPAVRDNELRVEYMGSSVRYVVHVNYIIAAVLAGVGGGLVALSIGHIDPDLAYWTTSGEFVFVAVLGGTGNVAAPVLASLLFEWIKSAAYQYAPYTWQMVLGITLLLVIMFLPAGLWSIFQRRAREA
ncbi:MAG: branched-chain amino acid ABC transporter permease [Bradyrhizobium sp.]|uniref:branched-chain amino acid ABC transporter permease n=1 Tax=Bradyrhizobium sp. TaxID=376 RepID=UPI001EC11737|nr:branched-chain amino acid ABC transporter permease [Bradyrhizobium sp.]MBU6456735.1 branched-chain amino acid ABC transporter permease [Bradyrhizobium sp.]MDE2603368.1 branched-chain amino acid ABC transporter permease [Bradyrhizobium sp.]